MSVISDGSNLSILMDRPEYFKVAVVTRTKNRPILLQRAHDSVAAQDFKNFCWIIVNDGGDESLIQRMLSNSSIEMNRIKIISNETSLGMEAASNIGVNSVYSEFIVIHDDDDSWDVKFLSRTVEFLENKINNIYDGVITYSKYVSELIRNDEVVKILERPYQHTIKGVNLDDVINNNLFPPISFVFRRSVFDKVGGFDESLPVLGDWMFNLEFLLQANIGVIPEFLAYYHHRDRPESTAPEYRNTVVDQIPLHEEYASIVRNRFFRNHISQSAISLRLALNGYNLERGSDSERSRVSVPSSVALLSRGDGDLAWTISVVNAALAEKRLSFKPKYRRMSPVLPNATWSVVLPLLQKLNVAVPYPTDFDEAAYLRDNPDVAAEVRRGNQKSGFTHYLLHGRHEGRPRPSGEYSSQIDRQSFHTPAVASLRPIFNPPVLRFGHNVQGFEKVLHVAHHEWHGIRQATAYSPGHKLLIPAHEAIDNSEKRSIAETVARMGINRICFQGYSDNADALLLFLRSVVGPAIKYFVVSHVTSSQFDNQFEMVVIARLLNRLKFGLIDGLASVKPGFGQAIEGFYKRTIINYAPNLTMPEGRRSSLVEVYAPLDVGWRKNLFTNIMAATLASNVDTIKTANFPNGLENIQDTHKLRLVGYLRGRDLLDEMARSSLTLIATLAECQPMTQLESFAVGTPALTGPLYLEEFVGDPLIELCTTHYLDNPALLAKDIEKIVARLKNDPIAIRQMIEQHLDHRHDIATQNYAEFLEI